MLIFLKKFKIVAQYKNLSFPLILGRKVEIIRTISALLFENNSSM
jgi:hypothetical protein